MGTIETQKNFFHDQIQEIKQYLQNCAPEDRNAAVMKWIDENAADYRNNWEEEHCML